MHLPVQLDAATNLGKRFGVLAVTGHLGEIPRGLAHRIQGPKDGRSRPHMVRKGRATGNLIRIGTAQGEG